MKFPRTTTRAVIRMKIRATPLALLLAGALASAAASAQSRSNEFDGLIEPSQTIAVRSPVTGLIERIHVGRGTTVKKGQVVVSLEASVERAATELARYRAAMDGAVKAADSRVAFAESKLKRKAALADKNYTSVQDRDDADLEQRIAVSDAQAARENRQVAKLEADLATAQLNQKLIRSPVDGVVVEQAMYPGEMAEPGDSKSPILKLAQIDPLRVTVILPAALYPKLKLGMRAEVSPEKPMEGRYATTITMIDRVIDAASGTFRIHLSLPNPEGKLPGGLKCRVTFPDLK